jgi:hypothetical protein
MEQAESHVFYAAGWHKSYPVAEYGQEPRLSSQTQQEHH